VTAQALKIPIARTAIVVIIVENFFGADVAERIMANGGGSNFGIYHPSSATCQMGVSVLKSIAISYVLPYHKL
jgi:hypothetical protein